MDERLEEALTLHKLGLVEQLGKSLLTTNIIENLNSQFGGYIRKVKNWSSSKKQCSQLKEANVAKAISLFISTVA